MSRDRRRPTRIMRSSALRSMASSYNGSSAALAQTAPATARPSSIWPVDRLVAGVGLARRTSTVSAGKEYACPARYAETDSASAASMTMPRRSAAAAARTVRPAARPAPPDRCGIADGIRFFFILHHLHSILSAAPPLARPRHQKIHFRRSNVLVAERQLHRAMIAAHDLLDGSSRIPAVRSAR